MKINGMNITSEEDILQALQKVEEGEEEFAVLERDKLFYMQTSGENLEYRNGATHFRTTDVPLEPERIRAAFMSFYHGDYEYQIIFNWKVMPQRSVWITIKGLLRCLVKFCKRIKNK